MNPHYERSGLIVGALVLAALVPFAASAQAAATPKPVFGKLKIAPLSIVLVNDNLVSGDKGEVAIRTRLASRCSLSLAGPSGLEAGPFSGALASKYGIWTWKVPQNVRGGLWSLKVACTHGGKTLTRSTSVHVALTKKNHLPLVTGNTIDFARSKRTPQPKNATSTGKGSDAYPNQDATCEWGSGRGGTCHNYDWGYIVGGRWQVLSSRGFGFRNCTDYVAWFLGLNHASFRFPANKGNALNWKAFASNAGYQVTSTPSVNDIAWWGGEVGGGYGHVAVVSAVNPNGTVTIAEYNGAGTGRFDLRPNVHADAYLHKPALPPAPIVTTTTPTVTTPTTSTPTTSTPTPGTTTPTTGTTQPPTSTTGNTTPVTPPAPQTWAETTGGVAHTWTNYTNAGGTEGPSIGSNATVQIACKLNGFTVADGNNWWYRIASGPWNNQYYVSADAFYNNRATSGSLHGTPYFDPAVANC